MERSEEAHAASVAHEPVAARDRLESVRFRGQLHLEDRGRARALRLGDEHHAIAAVGDLVPVEHAQVRAAALDADLELARGSAARIRGRIGDRELDAVLALAGREAEARAERHVAHARAHEVDHVGRVRDALEAEAPVGVGAAHAQARAAVPGARVEQHVDLRGRGRPRRVHEAARHDRGAGRNVGVALLRLRERGRRDEQQERRGRERRECTRVHRRSGCGHITASVPSTNTAPPIQIQFTSGLR